MKPPNPLSRQHCKNYDVKRESVRFYPRNVHRCCTWSERWRWPVVVAGISARFSKFACFVLHYNESLNDWFLGQRWIFPRLRLEKKKTKFPGNTIQFLSWPVIEVIKWLPKWLGTNEFTNLIGWNRYRKRSKFSMWTDYVWRWKSCKLKRKNIDYFLLTIFI